MRKKGKIAAWHDDKGYGFIAPIGGGPKIFIHIKAISNRNRRPEIGDVVTYAVTKDEQGRTRAENATLAAYVVMSILTFIAYAIDKSAAQNGRWRTNESALHLLALIGGWPGAWIAQQTLRHKSRKIEFRVVFWITVLLNCGGLVWLHTSDGQANMEQLFGTNSSATTMGPSGRA